MSDVFKTGAHQDRAYNLHHDNVRCDYINCFAGEGMAGRDVCFLNGDPTREDCPNFESEAVALVSAGVEDMP